MRCFASCSIHIGTFNENRAGLSSQLYFFVLRLENMIGKYHGYDTKEIELLSPKPQTITMSEDHVALLSNSIDELLNPKTATPIEGRLQPLNSNSIDELISPKTGNLTQSEVDLPPLTSSISLAKLLKEICVRA